jgi:hypothetical protein
MRRRYYQWQRARRWRFTLYSGRVSQALLLWDTAAALATLERVFRWAIAQQPPLRPADVVIQDEYTHDVLFAASDGSWLVFDAT